MSRRHKYPKHLPLSPADLKARLHRAEQEGRFQQALELAKNLHKEDPSPPHLELYKRMVLKRARQQRSQGHIQEGQITLENAVVLDSAQVWQEQLAQELAGLGAVARALELLRPFPESNILPAVMSRAVDAALGAGKGGRNLLPESLLPQFEALLQAFAHAEAGRDEDARAALQSIGLQSPFLEWKLLLRGVLAYYQNDDPRALENWQRLDPERLPARLAAPLRFIIDPAYRLAQSPTAQTSLQHQADRLQQSGLVQPLRTLQAALAHERQLPQAFRQAENLLAALRQEAPHLVPRLAACFYWTIIHAGQPEDQPRYQRVFGAPPADPTFARMHALALEQRMELKDAHKAWQDYESGVARHPETWPGDQADRVRALIWYHMGLNAAKLPEQEDLAQLPPFLRDHPERPRPLSPGAAECFERSLQLAPDQLEAYQALFGYHQRKKATAEAVKAGKRLLERFPDHVSTLEVMADLRIKQKKHALALELLQRALKHNPLERRLRGKLSHAHLLNARQYAEACAFDSARREYQSALALEERTQDSHVRCKWAACEFKAKNAERAEQLLQESLAGEGKRLPVAYNMLIEAIRLKLPRPIKTRFDREFKESLAEPPSARTAVELARTASIHAAAEISYVGQKTHEKKVLAYLDRASALDLTETQLLDICRSFAHLEARKLALKYFRLGQRKFPANPEFFLAEAVQTLDREPGGRGSDTWRAEHLLQKAQELATALPPDERRKDLLERITECQQLLELANPFSRLSSMMEGMMNPPGFDEDDFDDDDEGDWLDSFF